jgi:hypothetical protein
MEWACIGIRKDWRGRDSGSKARESIGLILTIIRKKKIVPLSTE